MLKFRVIRFSLGTKYYGTPNKKEYYFNLHYWEQKQNLFYNIPGIKVQYQLIAQQSSLCTYDSSAI